jgi:hypothetical protein
MPCGEEEGLGGGDDVLRLGRDDPEWVEYDHDGDRWVPTPKGMQFDDDGLSGYWRQHVEGPHAEHIGVVTRAPYYLLFQFSVAYARSLDFDVRHDPLGAHLSDCAHTAVNYRPGRLIGSSRSSPARGSSSRLS